MKPSLLKAYILCTLMLCQLISIGQSVSYPVAGTNQQTFFSASGIITIPSASDPFYGQDPQYVRNTPSYTDQGNGTITDNVTGLMWQKNMGLKSSFPDAIVKADTLTLGGYSDWRVPTIKELYSLILFSGKEGSMDDSSSFIKYLDTAYFDQPFGNTAIGERLIDAQTWSQNQYTGLTMGGDSTIFGVNFIDGRIKGYPKYVPQTTTLMTAYFRMVRGNTQYGINDFTDNGDGTVSDNATGLMWQQADDSTARDWENALSYAENLTIAGYTDWRLPDAKELQTIVDYSRCPQSTTSPAIDPVFDVTEIMDPNGISGQYPYFWTGTTHMTGPVVGNHAAYIAFGRAQGKMNNTLMDVHGAGSQRSDPKSGNAASYPAYFGPQGDVQYVYNYSRCVRNIAASGIGKEDQKIQNPLRLWPNPASTTLNISIGQDVKGYTSLEIFSFDGQKIVSHQLQLSSVQSVIDVSELPAGVYLIRILCNGIYYTRKFIRD